MIASSAPAWAVWLALGLWGVAIIALAVAVALARRLWRDRLAPMVAPMLSMFSPPSDAERERMTKMFGELGSGAPDA